MMLRGAAGIKERAVSNEDRDSKVNSVRCDNSDNKEQGILSVLSILFLRKKLFSVFDN
jgi:hypothetical protein